MEMTMIEFVGVRQGFTTETQKPRQCEITDARGWTQMTAFNPDPSAFIGG